jgi:signal peptidase II
MIHRRIWPWYAAVAGLLALDQVTKLLVRRLMTLHQSIPVIGDDFFRLTYVQNPGIAFGLRAIGRWPLLIFGWLASIALAVYLYRLIKRHDPLRWPVMLFFAGALGNSIDRLFLGGLVTDFADFDFPDFIMDRWPIFNVADSCVTLGICALILIILFDRREKDHPATHSSADDHHSDQTLSVDDRSGSSPDAH